jgi:hypothetical protein
LGKVVYGDFGGDASAVWLSKKQFAKLVGRSTRWLELRVREGLPSEMRNGRRQFLPRDAQPWIDRYHEQHPLGGSEPVRPEPDQGPELDLEDPEVEGKRDGAPAPEAA